jgi:gliding motility associated protien GldN
MRKVMNKWMLMAMVAVLCYTSSIGQNVLDGVYVPEHHTARKVIPYTPLREADVMWSKRVWRVIDLREKINHPLYFPTEKINNRRSLTQVIIDAVQEGGSGLTAFSSMDDEFKVKLEPSEIQAMLVKTDTLFDFDADGNSIPKPIVIPFDPSSVKRYRLKEDWFFDKQKSVLEVRIIGICPVQESFDEEGNYRGESPLFWVYFPEAREIFVNIEVFNRNNDAERRTLEDVFWKRQFSSYIIKESNVYDRKIVEYKNNLDLLLEAKKIKDEIFNKEQDLWEY